MKAKSERHSTKMALVKPLLCRNLRLRYVRADYEYGHPSKIGTPSLPLPSGAHASGPDFRKRLVCVRAEAFARFFGTPLLLVAQTIIVAVWILLNVVGMSKFDVYPFILLNLAFSLQAAYAAPLILLAQTRQSDRDKAHAEADVEHREAMKPAWSDKDSPLSRGRSSSNWFSRTRRLRRS